MNFDLLHGGNREALASELGISSFQLIDASSSLFPWTPRLNLNKKAALRDYPDRQYKQLCKQIAQIHGVAEEAVLPGNGAAELFTWAGREAASTGLSILPSPGFADYRRAVKCWNGLAREQFLPLEWNSIFPHEYPDPKVGDVMWICNPHNPTGQLWSLRSLENLVKRYSLVICDEAFLPLVPGGSSHSLIPCIERFPNLIIVRSLTKLFGIAGLRLGYAIADPERLRRWRSWRDPWPVNGLAILVADELLKNPVRYDNWCLKVQKWAKNEQVWMQTKLSEFKYISSMPSCSNFLLINSQYSLVSLREAIERNHRIMLRDCRSFSGLGEKWLRIGLQNRMNNKRILRAIFLETKHHLME